MDYLKRIEIIDGYFDRFMAELEQAGKLKSPSQQMQAMLQLREVFADMYDEVYERALTDNKPSL